jgi:hypothetical protein
MTALSIDQTSAIALGWVVAWLAGMRAYLTVFWMGMAGALGWIALPPALHTLASVWCLSTCALLMLVEFIADKIPGVDGGWDLIHTFVRLPLGAVLAAPLLSGNGRIGTGVLLAGGAAALASHTLKSSTRRLINTTPEPLSNWSASLAEDLLCVAVLVLAIAHPWLGLGIAVVGSALIAVVVRCSFGATMSIRADREKEVLTPCP